MRTQSLGMVDHAARKIKEKDWYETSLDAARPPPTPPLPAHTPTPGGSSTRSSEADLMDLPTHMPISQQLSFDTASSPILYLTHNTQFKIIHEYVFVLMHNYDL